MYAQIESGKSNHSGQNNRQNSPFPGQHPQTDQCNGKGSAGMARWK